MRILVDHGNYQLQNLGDVAMLQAAVGRLAQHWPQAEIQVFCQDPDRLALFCPQARPLPASGYREWRRDGLLFGALARRSSRLAAMERQLRFRKPQLTYMLLRWRWRQYPAAWQYLEAIYNADLVVGSGGGYLTDAFRGQAASVLETLRLAHVYGKPTALLGQGLGPIENAWLRELARQTLPLLDLLVLRERRSGPALADSLGALAQRVLISGDDSLELAYTQRRKELGSALGLNLRVAEYAQTDAESLAGLAGLAEQLQARYAARLQGIPISLDPSDTDRDTLRQLLHSDAAAQAQLEQLQTPAQVLSAVSACRVVIGGSYHALVFALAQGIPAIGLARSPYYAQKLLGLQDLFGTGCRVLWLGEPGWQEQLRATLDELWQTAPQLRPALLATTEQQIAAARSAYQRVYELVTQRQPHAERMRSTQATA